VITETATPATTEAAAPEAGLGSARERLLAAADELFYDQGIHVVGIDRIIERAGVAKASLYSLFGNKEGLILAYLQARLERRQSRINAAIAQAETPRDRVLAVFDALSAYISDPRFHGCADINAAAESEPGSAVEAAVEVSRRWRRSLFVDLVRDAGAKDPDFLGSQLVMLYDGAMVTARMDGNVEAAAVARQTATALLDASVDQPTTSSRSRRTS
jgi:AcrR family transcriptional regulator